MIAIGLEKHLNHIEETNERMRWKKTPFALTCERMSKDTIFGKSKRRIYDHAKVLRKQKQYNPVQVSDFIVDVVLKRINFILNCT